MRLLKSTRIVLVVCLLLTIYGCGGGQPTITIEPPEPQETFESYLQSQQFSGTVYIARDGEALLNQGFGLSDKDSQALNTPFTRFRIGSVTKQFTAAAILTLVDQGMLSLDDYVSDHLADFPHGSQITLKHLLTHTSGIPNYTALSGFEDVLSDSKTPQQLLDMFKNLPLEFSPGSQFAYSNSGYVVLGVIIEQVSGMSYQDYMRDFVFAPMAMFDSGYARNEPIEEYEARGYLADGSSAPFIHISLPYSAGALESTLGDLALWDQALYDNTLLSEEATALMFTPSLNQYALGWRVTTIAETGEPIQVHGGNIAGFSSVIIRFPESRKLIVVLANIDNYPVNRLAVNLNVMVEAGAQ